MFNTVRGAALLALLANLLLVTLKLTVGLLSGSISVLSDALDSGLDLVGSILAAVAIRASEKPADAEHPYGHGKLENVSGVIESSLILLGSLLITGESIRRLLAGIVVDAPILAIVGMTLSLGINFVVSRQLRRVAKQSGSVALQATAWHRASDMLTSLGVLLGLIVVAVTPWDFLDAYVAIAIAAFIAYTAVRLFIRAFSDLLDRRLPDTEEGKVRAVFRRNAQKFVGYHSLRTRRAGRDRYIELHLVVPRLTTVAAAHALTDLLESELEENLPGAIATIHIEPCDVPAATCDAHCLGALQPYCYRTATAAQDQERFHPHGPR